MDKLHLAAILSAEANGSPARLKIFKIAAGRNFTIEALSRHPGFDIISFSRRKTQIRSAKANRAMRNSLSFEYLFSIYCQFFQFRIRNFRLSKLYHFDFVELVLANQSPRILTVRTGLG